MSSCHQRGQFRSDLTTKDADLRTAVRRLERAPESTRLRESVADAMSARNETRRLLSLHESECATCAGPSS